MSSSRFSASPPPLRCSPPGALSGSRSDRGPGRGHRSAGACRLRAEPRRSVELAHAGEPASSRRLRSSASSTCPSASKRDAFPPVASAASRSSVVSPMPRAGVLMMRARSMSLAGFIEHPQVRERVLDLGPLVELRARRRSGRARSPRAAPPRARGTGRAPGRRRRSPSGRRPVGPASRIAPRRRRPRLARPAPRRPGRAPRRGSPSTAPSAAVARPSDDPERRADDAPLER